MPADTPAPTDQELLAICDHIGDWAVCFAHPGVVRLADAARRLLAERDALATEFDLVAAFVKDRFGVTDVDTRPFAETVIGLLNGLLRLRAELDAARAVGEELRAWGDRFPKGKGFSTAATRDFLCGLADRLTATRSAGLGLRSAGP